MMRQLILAAVFMFLAFNGNAQWQKFYPEIGTNEVVDIYFVNSDSGYAKIGCHDSTFYIIQTEDGGDHWKVVYKDTTGFSSFLRGCAGFFLHFFTFKEGVLFNLRALYATHDAGKTWKRIRKVPYGTHITIYDSTLAFSTWTSGTTTRITGNFNHYTSLKYYLRNIKFVKNKIFKALGWTNDTPSKQMLMISRDTGKTWQYFADLPDKLTRIKKLQFITRDTGYGVFSEKRGRKEIEKLWKTVDGGKTWQMILNFDKDEKNVFGFFAGGLYFMNPRIGYLGMSIGIYKTIDGGKNWYQQINRSDGYGAFQFFNDSIGYVSRPEGVQYMLGYYKTANGGGPIDTADTSGTGGLSTTSPRAPYFKIYPNPVKTWITAELRGLKGKQAQVQLLDARGKRFRNATAPIVRGNLLWHTRLKDLPGGLYILRVSDRQGSYRKRFVKY